MMAAITAPGSTTEIVDLTQERVTSYDSFYRSDQADVYDGSNLGLLNAFKVVGAVHQGAESVANERRELLSGILQTRELPQAVVTLLPSDRLQHLHCRGQRAEYFHIQHHGLR